MESGVFSAFKETVKGSLAFGVSASLVAAVGFLLIPVYTRYLAVEEFGLFGLISLTTSTLAAIFGLGLSTAIFRSYFDYDDIASQRKLVGTALLVAMAGSASLFLLATLTAEPLIARSIFKLPNTGRYFQIALYAGAIGLLNAVPLAVYRAKKQFGRYAFINGMVAFLQLILIIVLVVHFRLGVKGIVIAHLFAALIINAILLFSIRSSIKFVILWNEVRKLLSYGLPLLPGGVFFLLLNSGGLYFVKAAMGLSEVAILNLAIKIASIITFFVISPLQLIWPPMMFSVEKRSYAGTFYARMLVYAVYVSVGFSIILSVFSREIVRVLSTPKYEAAAPLVSVLLIGHILFVVQNVFNVGILLKRKTAYWSLAMIIETIISILGWLVLAPRLGMLGIAIGSALGFGVGAGITLVFSRKFLKINYEWRRAFIIFALYPFAFVMSLMIPASLNAISIFLKGILVLFCLGAPFLFKLWYPEEIQAIKGFIRQIFNRFAKKTFFNPQT